LSSAAVHEPAKVRDPRSLTLDNCTAATTARVGFWPSFQLDSIATDHVLGSSSPPGIFMEVDLPQPLAPIKP